MSSQYDNTNSGALFKNDRKEQDSHPDYAGNLNVDGKEFWIDAWLNVAKGSGKKYMKLRVRPKLSSDSGSPPTGGRNDPRPSSGGRW